MVSLKRDADMEKIAKELREKRGAESLMEKHTKKLKVTYGRVMISFDFSIKFAVNFF